MVVLLFEAVIFDWDGTLADTKDLVLTSFRKALEDLPIEVDEKLIKSLLGKRAKEIFYVVLQRFGMSFDEEIINELVGKRVEAELELGSCVELRDGALDLLSSLKVKVKLALASMNNKQVIENMLNSCGLKDFFDVVLSADEVSEPKPDPEIFLKCASKLRLKPAIIVVVEDSTFGVRAAKAANMNCIAVISGVSDRNELELEKPDLIIGSVKEKEKNSEIRAQLKKMNPILNGVIVCVEHVKNAWYVLANYSLWVEYVCTQEQVEISPATPLIFLENMRVW